tara:strand:- start:620 stop:2488 length:1869 start_codon:yes stop_codon:yes gene_type:complete
MYLKLIVIFLILTINSYADELKKCKWDNREGVPCIVISKTPNTSDISEETINKIIINKNQIEQSGAVDVIDVLKYVDGLEIKQNGQRGQLTSLFMRGTNSNHTLVLMNGIPINDQSTTQGLHNFGQDFVQTIQQIEIYKGPSGAHFGPSAIGGAINFVTAIDYKNKVSVSGYDSKNNSIDINHTKIMDNGWHLNFKGSSTNSKSDSARYSGKEDDSSKNYQVNINSEKWMSDNLKAQSTVYVRRTKSNYDTSTSDESGWAHDKMYVAQTGLSKITSNSENDLRLHFAHYNREYDEGGYFSWYNSDSIVIKADRRIKSTNKFSYGFGTEYKYDTASFFNDGSWSQPSTNGNVDNLSAFANAGYKFSDRTTLSLYGRGDNHKTTGLNSTYKFNITQIYNNFSYGLTHSTGLRNPSLYELYGNNGRTDSYKIVANPNANPEKSRTNELNIKYFLNEFLSLDNTFYRTFIEDGLLYNSNYNGGAGYTNSASDLKQDGIESKFSFTNKSHKLSVFNNISSSKKVDGTRQLNRPDSTYGINYNYKIKNSFIGPIDLYYNYKHYGKSFDYAPSVQKVDSTDIMNVSFVKNLNFLVVSFNITNLLDENYQRPYGYSQNGRLFNIKMKLSY